MGRAQWWKEASPAEQGAAWNAVRSWRTATENDAELGPRFAQHEATIRGQIDQKYGSGLTSYLNGQDVNHVVFADLVELHARRDQDRDPRPREPQNDRGNGQVRVVLPAGKALPDRGMAPRKAVTPEEGAHRRQAWTAAKEQFLTSYQPETSLVDSSERDVAGKRAWDKLPQKDQWASYWNQYDTPQTRTVLSDSPQDLALRLGVTDGLIGGQDALDRADRLVEFADVDRQDGHPTQAGADLTGADREGAQADDQRLSAGDALPVEQDAVQVPWDSAQRRDADAAAMLDAGVDAESVHAKMVSDRGNGTDPRLTARSGKAQGTAPSQGATGRGAQRSQDRSRGR